MRNNLLKQSDLIICSHRGGYYQRLPENSIQVFDYVARYTYLRPICMEVDVRASKNGTLYLMHDETINRTTDGYGKIPDLTDTYLSKLYLKDSLGGLTNQRVPTFQELITFAQTRDLILMLDIKEDVWDAALSLIHQAALKRPPVVLTFKREHTQRVFDLSEQVLVSVLIASLEDLAFYKRFPGNRLVAYVSHDASDSLIREIRGFGIRCVTALAEVASGKVKLDTSSSYVALVDRLKLDFLITDFPVEVSQSVCSISGCNRGQSG